jgi:shikimate dehydrogenase
MTLKIVDKIDETASTIGAISCITLQKDGSLLGTNNDWYGFMANLKQEHPDWRANAGPAVVIGAGGASRAVCYGLMHEGVEEIRLVNRTYAKADTLAKQFGKSIKPLPWKMRHQALEDVTIVINTTNQGMVGELPLDISLDHLPNSAIAADIIYVPLETPFLTAAKHRGNRTLNGIGMLLHQGIPAWKQWFSIEPVVTPELKEMMESSLIKI